MEEEIDELRAKVIASMPSSANPSSAPKPNSSNSKEEGELSSGDDAGMPSCSTAQPNITNLLENFRGNTLNNQPHRIKSAKAPLASSSSMVNVQPRTSVSRNYSKHLKTNQGPFQSSIPQSLSWRGRVSDNNLVISFSDDDSRSNSEETIPNKGVSRKSTASAVKSGVPISSKQAHSGGLQGWPNRAKPVRKKGTVNPAPISSRGASFRHSIASPEKDTLVLKHSPVIKMSSRQERGLVRGADTVDQTVENLRHEIALRENKLKFQSKSTPQSNVRSAVSYSENHGPLENMVSSISRPVYVTAGLASKVAVSRPDSVTAVRGPQFVTTIGFAPNEQVTKRPKLDEQFNSKSSSDGQLQLLIPSDVSAHEFGGQPMESSNFCRDREVMGCHKGGNDAHTYPPVSCVVSVKDAKDDNSLVPACEPICSLGNSEVPSSEHENCTMLVADVSCSSDKFGKRDRAVDPPANLHQGSYFTHTASDMHAEALRESDKSSSTILRAESVKRSSISKKIDASNPSPERAPCKHNMERSQQIITGHNAGVPLEISKRIPDEHSIEIPGRKLGNHEAYLQNTSLFNYSSQINFSGEAAMNLQSLMDLEELKDKELEEAQELRRRCELEERHALKEYRKAQRALVEANERCSQLYRKRELFSAQLRTLLMDASSSIWSSNWQSHKGTVSEPLKTVPESNFSLLSSLGNQLPAGQILDQLAYESNTGCPVDAPHNSSREPMDGQEFCSGQCSEQDATTSDHRANSALDGVCTHAHHPNVSIDDDENFLFDNRSVESRLACDVGDGNCGQRTADVNAESERLPSDGNEQNYELLEASLRSKLVARLGKRMPSKTNEFSNKECKNNSASVLNQQIQEKDETQTSGVERREGSTGQLTAEIHSQCHGNSFSLGDEVYGNRVVEDNCSFPRETCWPAQTTAFSLPSSVLHVVYGHMKSILPDSCNELSTTEENVTTLRTSPRKNINCVPDDGGSIACNNIRSAETRKIELQDCDRTIDPFWPFCTFELRGKCNDDECRFQHLKRCTMRNLKHNEHSANSCSVPAYCIGSSQIKVNSFLSRSILARSVWHYWQRGFCASFPLPFSIRRDLPADAPFLQSSAGPIADDYSWNRLSLYYQTLDCTMVDEKQFVQPEPEQSLEMALYLFDMNVNRPHRKKALSLLSRAIEAIKAIEAIEAVPTSVVLWVAYLHIYYGQEKSIGKDDMFLHAVQNNEDSYELWLLYINSRIHLSDRLKAYEYALTTFCNKENAFTKERRYISACILDIFLQMIDFLCMCGDVEKAILKISELLETSGDTLLLKIHSCLIVSDRCIFWFCCIYLAIYRKLPNVIIEQFEFEKVLPFVVDWPSVHLTTQRKDCALGLTKLAVDNMTLDFEMNPHKKDPTALRSLQFLAVSHIRFVAALEGLHHSAELVANYLTLYPTCIELVLVAARFREKCNGDVIFRGFEELLASWPKEIPGAQCLWNQYAEHALADKRIDFAENLMIRWFQRFCEGKDVCDRKLEGTKASQSECFDLHSHNNSDCGFSYFKKDDMFGFLNLSLKRMLQKNFREAQLAIDKALKLASPEDYKHCVREHAAFTFSNGLDSRTNVSFAAVLGLLNFYMADSRSTSILEPLSRNFYQNIKKPRVRHFMDNILGPVSRDVTLMNSVLEACYGPSLLPESFDDLKDFVDFVESLMEIAPANYKLALSVYRITATIFHHARVAASAIKFWASSLLINSIFQAVPVAPEHVWLEAAHLMRDSGSPDISQRFHQQAISVYPFSIKLWQSFLIVSKNAGNADTILRIGRERGLELSQVPD